MDTFGAEPFSGRTSQHVDQTARPLAEQYLRQLLHFGQRDHRKRQQHQHADHPHHADAEVHVILERIGQGGRDAERERVRAKARKRALGRSVGRR